MSVPSNDDAVTVPADGPEEHEPMSFGRRTARVLAVLVMLAIAALWSYTAPDATSRAEVIAQANGSLRTMLADLRANAPAATSGNDGRMIDEWLTDWNTYMGDRERYVTALEADSTARFYVTEKTKGQQITKPIDFFATYNDMPNCVTPGDLG